MDRPEQRLLLSISIIIRAWSFVHRLMWDISVVIFKIANIWIMSATLYPWMRRSGMESALYHFRQDVNLRTYRPSYTRFVKLHPLVLRPVQRGYYMSLAEITWLVHAYISKSKSIQWKMENIRTSKTAFKLSLENRLKRLRTQQTLQLWWRPSRS
jgi:hypothetical protein